MLTSIHIPRELLAEVDQKARALRISRNSLIVRALEQEVQPRGWPPGFTDHLRSRPAGLDHAVEQMLRGIRLHRAVTRPPPRL